MSIRKLQYQIDFVHILTFREEYKKAILPFFGFENLEYGIDNEGSINESIRLIFKNEQMALSLRKEAMTIIFEGDVKEFKNPNSPIKIFWDIYEKIKELEGYSRTIRQHLIIHAVEIGDKENIKKILEKNPYLSLNPFGALDEFCCVYEFKKKDIQYKLEFGNYSEKDIKKHDLTPFKTKYNEDLVNNVGLMGRLEVTEIEKNPTFNKLKTLLFESSAMLTPFSIIENE